MEPSPSLEEKASQAPHESTVPRKHLPFPGALLSPASDLSLRMERVEMNQEQQPFKVSIDKTLTVSPESQGSLNRGNVRTGTLIMPSQRQELRRANSGPIHRVKDASSRLASQQGCRRSQSPPKSSSLLPPILSQSRRLMDAVALGERTWASMPPRLYASTLPPIQGPPGTFYQSTEPSMYSISSASQRPQTNRKRSFTIAQLESSTVPDIITTSEKHKGKPAIDRLLAPLDTRPQEARTTGLRFPLFCEPFDGNLPRMHPRGSLSSTLSMTESTASFSSFGSYSYSLPSTPASSAYPELPLITSSAQRSDDSLSVSSDEDVENECRSQPYFATTRVPGKGHQSTTSSVLSDAETVKKRMRLSSPFELHHITAERKNQPGIQPERHSPSKRALPLSALSVTTLAPQSVPSSGSPIDYVRKLKIFLSDASKVFRGFDDGKKLIKLAPGSMVTSRAIFDHPARHLAHSYTAAPKQPLDELRAASREIWGKSFEASRPKFPIVHRFPIPEVRFDRKGKSHLSTQGMPSPPDGSDPEEWIACIMYNGNFWITGLHICRIIKFRFEAFGRRITNLNKFHEGIYSDLRNLRSGNGSVCEDPRSSFLQVLHAYGAVNTRKQQKVFMWDQTPHDRLFLAQLDRDLERQSRGQETVSVPVAEPALSFSYNTHKSLLEQLGFEKTRAAVTMTHESTTSPSKASSRAPSRRHSSKSITVEGLAGLALGAEDTPAFVRAALGLKEP